MTQVALYVRQSLDVQEGIDRQRLRCEALASQRGWTVVDTFTDNDTSATKPRGPGTAWSALLEAARSGRIQGVVAVDMDRLLRSMRDLVTLTDIGLSVTTVDGQIDLSTADGRFRAQMLASVAEFETRRKSERQQRAAEHRASLGRPTAGKRPFGWEPDRVTLRESEAAVLRDMTQAIIDGESVRGITRWLNAEDIPTSLGGTWIPEAVRKALVRPRNAGLLIRRGEIQPLSLIQPAVSREDWELVCSILAGRAGRRGPLPEGNWLSGILTCTCGHTMHVKHVHGRGAAGTRTRVRTYICGAARDGAKHVTVQADIAESYVTDAMFGWLAAGPSEDLPGEMRDVQEELVTLAQQRADATDALLTPGVDRGRVKVRLAEIEAATARAEARRAELAADATSLRAVLDALPPIGDIEDVDAEPFRVAWNALDTEKRRALVRTSLSVTVKAGGKGARRLSVLPR